MQHPRWAVQPPPRNSTLSDPGTDPVCEPFIPLLALHACILTRVRGRGEEGGWKFGPGLWGHPWPPGEPNLFPVSQEPETHLSVSGDVVGASRLVAWPREGEKA